MTSEIPAYGLRAYALLFTRYGAKQPFQQKELDWFVSQSMRKKIFSVLMHAGWIRKHDRNTYTCISPEENIRHLLDFKVPEIISSAKKEYAFTGLSAIEIWSDYSYVQRSRERSPYFIKINHREVKYWKDFFNSYNIPNYVKSGSTIGEYVVLIPAAKVKPSVKDQLKVDSLKETLNEAKKNEMFKYAYVYMKKRYGTPAT
jgi:hypothetical protein